MGDNLASIPTSANRSRRNSAILLQLSDAATANGISERAFASDVGVPRTSIQYLRSRRDNINAAPEVVRFFESPHGIVVLEGLVFAAHFAISLLGVGGIRVVCQFLELSGLDRFIGTSYGSQQAIASEIVDLVARFGDEERSRLATEMTHKSITLCEDETFPSQGQCLVAMEPVSGFVLAESYHERRDAQTWNEVVESATEGLKVDIEQITSDGAKALIRHAKDQGAHHSPDLFHVQQEVTRGLGSAMHHHVKSAEAALEQAAAGLDRARDAKREHDEGPRRRGRPPNFAKRIREAAETVDKACIDLDDARHRREAYQTTVRDISASYHPYDLTHASPRTADAFSMEMEDHFGKLDRLADEVGLSASRRAKIGKARRVMPSMVQTIAFFHERVEQIVRTEELPVEHEDILFGALIPASYQLDAASKGQVADERHRLEDFAAATYNNIRARMDSLDAADRERLALIAQRCAEVFQRSSSAVEGRNGRLALAEHAGRRLPERKLRAMTVIHNYVIKRSGTTAAERFFGVPPRSAFHWMVDRLGDLPRPARRRQKSTPKARVLRL